MKIYVAAKFEEKQLVKEVQAALVKAGHTITHDWTNKPATDLNGVREADLLVLLLPPAGGESMIELGAALALDKHVLLVLSSMDAGIDNVFFALPQVQRLIRADSTNPELVAIQIVQEIWHRRWPKGKTELSTLIGDVHENAVKHGWWEGENPNIPEKLALIHSEISEALEEYRVHGSSRLVAYNGPDHKPEGFIVELADTVIRIFDLVGYITRGQAPNFFAEILAEKHVYNVTRPYRHGDKKC